MTSTQSITIYSSICFLGISKPTIFSSSNIRSLLNLTSTNLKFCVVILRLSSTLIVATLSAIGRRPAKERIKTRRSHNSSLEAPQECIETKPLSSYSSSFTPRIDKSKFFGRNSKNKGLFLLFKIKCAELVYAYKTALKSLPITTSSQSYTCLFMNSTTRNILFLTLAN